MIEFAKYYIGFLGEFFRNIWKFFKTIGQAFADAFFNDIIGYFEDLINKSSGFGFFGWVFEFIVIVIMVGFFSFLILRIYQLIRRYVRFSKREIEKDALLEEIALLNMKTTELVDEKNKIMALKVSSLGVGGPATNRALGTDDNQVEEGEIIGPSRFVKLIAVDEKYKTELTSIMMEPNDMVGLPELVEKFINFAASQLKLYYDKKVIRSYFAGMATSKIIILEGISGTGKTSLPYAMGKFFRNDASIVSVQPSWRDRSEIIGYLNEFTKRFNETDFLKDLYETLYRDDLNFIVLDEMNLARIEYYFAEFLSIMEMPNPEDWKIDIVPDHWPTDPKNIIEGKILVPQNVWFIGTANRDDSTFTITDKVYDRATSIEISTRADFIDAPFTESTSMSYDYFNTLLKDGISQHPISTVNMKKLEKIDEFITDNFKITFGNRIMKQIKLFVPTYVACGGSELDGLDYMVFRKILRKFESLNIAFLKEEINKLIALFEKQFGKGNFTESITYLNELLRMS